MMPSRRSPLGPSLSPAPLRSRKLPRAGGRNRHTRTGWSGRLAAPVLVLALAFIGAGHAPAWAQEKAAVPLMIQTVPKMPRVTFSLDGETFRTDARGLALTTVRRRGLHRLRVESPRLRSDGVELAFAGWSDGSESRRRKVDVDTFTVLQAGFEASFETQWSFANRTGSGLDGGERMAVTLTNDRGEQSVFTGPGPHFVPGTRIVVRDGRLVQQRITYRLDRAVVDGVDVTTQVPETIQLGGSQRWRVSLAADAPAQPSAGSVSPSSETPASGPSPYLTVGVIVAGLALLALASTPYLRKRTAAGASPSSPVTLVSGSRLSSGRSQPAKGKSRGSEGRPGGLLSRMGRGNRPVERESGSAPPPPPAKRPPPPPPPTERQAPPRESATTSARPSPVPSVRVPRSLRKGAQPKHLMESRQAPPKHSIQPKHLVPKPAPRRSRWSSIVAVPGPTAEKADPGVLDEQSESSRRRVGKYTLLSRIGEGSRGEVFRAQDPLRRQVVVKLLHWTDDRALGLLRPKAEAAARVKHDNIVPLQDFGATAGVVYTVSPYVEGESLREILAREGPLRPLEAAEIASDVAAGLQAAHDKGVVHGALRPSCILVSAWSRALIADLGLPDLPRTRSGAPDEHEVETPLPPEGDERAYEAPELMEAAPQPASDIYSLGVLLCEMVTGSVELQTLSNGGEGSPGAELPKSQFGTAPAVPLDLRALILRATESDPSDRFGSAGEMLHHLEELVARHLQSVMGIRTTPHGGSQKTG